MNNSEYGALLALMRQPRADQTRPQLRGLPEAAQPVSVVEGGSAVTRTALLATAARLGLPCGEPVLADAGKAISMQAGRELAAAFIAESKAQRNPAPPFDSGTLGELLARPADPQARVEDLIPWQAGTLISAQRKTGKTTLELNFARSLLTGQEFLGRFGVRSISGSVALLNYEVSAGLIARWADEHGVDRRRLFVVNLRGRRNPLSHAADRSVLSGLLRAQNVETLIVDPFGRAFTGKSQNDAGEVGAWLQDLDAFARTEVGAMESGRGPPRLRADDPHAHTRRLGVTPCRCAGTQDQRGRRTRAADRAERLGRDQHLDTGGAAARGRSSAP